MCFIETKLNNSSIKQFIYESTCFLLKKSSVLLRLSFSALFQFYSYHQKIAFYICNLSSTSEMQKGTFSSVHCCIKFFILSYSSPPRFKYDTRKEQRGISSPVMMKLTERSPECSPSLTLEQPEFRQPFCKPQTLSQPLHGYFIFGLPQEQSNRCYRTF